MKKNTPEKSLMPAGGEAKYLQALLEEIAAHSLHTVKKIILFGECLCYIKEHKGQYGEWGDWCDSNIPNVNRRTLQRWMACYQNRKLIEDSEVNTPTDAYKLIAKTGKTTKNDTVSQASAANQQSTSSDSPSDPEQQAAEDCKNRDDEEEAGVVTHEETDIEGFPIPAHLVDFFHRRKEMDDLLHKTSTLATAIERMSKENDPLVAFVPQYVCDHLRAVYSSLKGSRPDILCWSCNGNDHKGCLDCAGTGFRSQWMGSQKKGEAKRQARLRKLKK